MRLEAPRQMGRKAACLLHTMMTSSSSPAGTVTRGVKLSNAGAHYTPGCDVRVTSNARQTLPRDAQQHNSSHAALPPLAWRDTARGKTRI